MFKVILIIIFCICVYEAGKMQGEKETFQRYDLGLVKEVVKPPKSDIRLQNIKI